MFAGGPKNYSYTTGKPSLDFNETRDSEWQWHQLSRMQLYSAPRSRRNTTPALGHSKVTANNWVVSCGW